MKKCIIILFLFIGFQVSAQKENPPKPATAKDFVLPQKKENHLSNGMKTVMVSYGNIPKVYVRLVIKTGNAHEGKDQVWLSDVLAKMMEQGTARFTARDLATKAARIGGSINVSAGPYAFTISGSALSQYASELIDMIADVALNPKLPEKELSRIKASLKRNLAVEKTKPTSIATEHFAKLVYGEQSPYGRFYPTEAMLESYTIKDVKDFYNNNLGAKRAVLYVAGIFDEAAVTRTISNQFKSWKAGKEVEYPAITKPYTAEELIVNRKDAPQTTIIIGMPVMDPKDADYTAFTIANSLLGASFGSRITANIRENKGYTYSPFSEVTVVPGSGVWAEEADVTSEHTIAAIKEIKNEIERLASEPPSAGELEGIQKYEAGIFVLRNSSPTGIISQLSFIDIFGLDESYLTERIKNIYAVSPAQVSQLVSKYIQPDKLTVVMVGDEKSIKEQKAR